MLVIFIALVPFAERVFTLVATPLMDRLPEGATMIATQVASPFLTPFKMCLFVAVFLAIARGALPRHGSSWRPVCIARRSASPSRCCSRASCSFYTGVSFAYFVVFPLMFSFFAAVSPEGVTMMTDIASYLDFILTIFFAFGLAFEVPIVTVMLVWSGLVSTQTLKKARPFVFLGAFVAGMLLTPPDAISQTLLAVPVYLLYESGLILARVLIAPKNAAEDAGEAGESTE